MLNQVTIKNDNIRSIKHFEVAWADIVVDVQFGSLQYSFIPNIQWTAFDLILILLSIYLYVYQVFTV